MWIKVSYVHQRFWLNLWSKRLVSITRKVDDVAGKLADLLIGWSSPVKFLTVRKDLSY